MEENFINSTYKQFEYYKVLGDKTFEQLNDSDLFWQSNAQSNSIAHIVNHLWGNMKSRWTDFLTTDGEKEWRNRDLEFEAVIQTKTELLAKWQEGWDCLFTALDTIHKNNFHTEIYIRNQRHTIVESVQRQIGHYGYHVGQIVFIGKMVKGENWKSLSIPKGKSKSFNQEKFSRGKHQGHFTDDLKK